MGKSKSAFITGAAGFIGSNLAKGLLNKGYKVVALMKQGQKHLFSHTDFEIREGDILDKQCLTDAAKGNDIIFHCAAFISFQPGDFRKSYDINVSGTSNLLEAAMRSGVKKVVHLSAASVLGYTNNPEDVIDESREFNVSKKNSYAYTKKMAEEVVKKYADQGLDVSIANISTVYGAGDKKMNSGGIIKAIYNNRIKFAPYGGTSYVSVVDLVEGLIALSENGRKGERYIFCSENLKYFELLNRIAKAIKSKPIKYILPRWTSLPLIYFSTLKDLFSRKFSNEVNILTAEIIKESYFYKYYSSKKTREELNWKPSVFLEEAVLEALDFYLKEGLI